MELENCTNFLLAKTQQFVNHFFKSELEPFGVTPGQFAVLRCLWDENGQTVKNLAERLMLDSSTMTSVLDRLEQKKLIKRKPDSQDRRAIKVIITKRGRELEGPMTDAVAKANEKAVAFVGGDTVEKLKRLLSEIKQSEFSNV
ncbi:MAG TPA: MarR family transcriptional regulator [Bacillota bacterium]|nr:MarR family transcriptional regulator [Bacillota bacterium]